MPTKHRVAGVCPMTDTGCVAISTSSKTSSHNYNVPSENVTLTRISEPSTPSRDSMVSNITSNARPLVRKYSSGRHKRHLLRRYHEWKSEHMHLGRYSIEKLLAFEEYQREASATRVFAVIALTPIPALIIVLLLAAIPLQSPLLSATANSVFFVQSWLSFSVVTFGMLLYMRCALALPQSVYSHWESAIIAMLTAGANEMLMIVVSLTWRFPIPLRDILGAPSYTTFLVAFHVLVLRTKLRHYYGRIRAYLPLCFAQFSTFFLFEGVAILFMNSPVWAKVTITVTFPLLRTVVKHMIRTFSHSLEDVSTEISLCVVEIFGSLFQNVCLQSSRSIMVSGFIILGDLLQALIEVQIYMERKYIVDGRHCVQTAVKIIHSSLFAGVVTSTKRYKSNHGMDKKQKVMKATHQGVSVTLQSTDTFSNPKSLASALARSKRTSKVACIARGSSEVLDMAVIQLGVLDRELLSQDPAITQNPQSFMTSTTSKTRLFSIDDVEVTHRYHAKFLTQTLQLLFASEVLVFAEYSEFASAFIYGLYTLIAYHFSSAKFNLCFIGLSTEEHWSSVVNCSIYAVSEGCTLLLHFTLVRAKFGISTLYQLAFVLEKYWMSVQGQIVGSLTLVFILHTVHQGTDLSLQFDWGHILNAGDC